MFLLFGKSALIAMVFILINEIFPIIFFSRWYLRELEEGNERRLLNNHFYADSLVQDFIFTLSILFFYVFELYLYFTQIWFLIGGFPSHNKRNNKFTKFYQIPDNILRLRYFKVFLRFKRRAGLETAEKLAVILIYEAVYIW